LGTSAGSTHGGFPPLEVTKPLLGESSIGETRPMIRCHRRAAVLIWLLLAGLMGCESSPAPERFEREDLLARTWPCNVLVVLLDAARADHFGYLGYDRPTTPNIDRLAAESIVFEQAYVQATGTANSIYSMFTSRYPVFEAVPDLVGQNAIFLADEATTWLEVLSERHPHRLVLSTNAFVRERLGLTQGATDVIEDWRPPARERRGEPPLYATRVTEPALAWIDAHADEGFVAYLHYLEPHEPYLPPEPFLSRFAGDSPRTQLGQTKRLRQLARRTPQPLMVDAVRDLYDGNLAYVDSHVGALMDSLRTRGVLDDTIVVLVSDHGEAFWEHGRRGHGHAPYEELIRVPLIVHLPTVPELAGTRIAEPVEFVDLMPTLMDLMGVPLETHELAGRSWVDVMIAGLGDPERTIHARSNRTKNPVYALRRGGWKWLMHSVDGREELYDLATDPGETLDLVAAGTADPDLLEGFHGAFRDWISGEGLPADATTPVDNRAMDPEVIESLRSLGYID